MSSMDGFRGRTKGAVPTPPPPPPFPRIYSKNHYNQPPFKWCCAIRVVLQVREKVALLPEFFWPFLFSDFSGSAIFSPNFFFTLYPGYWRDFSQVIHNLWNWWVKIMVRNYLVVHNFSLHYLTSCSLSWSSFSRAASSSSSSTYL